MAKEAFSARLRREIARHPDYPSERQFAIRNDIDTTYLSRVLNDPKWRPTAEYVVKIARGLGKTAAEVESWTDRPDLYGGDPAQETGRPGEQDAYDEFAVDLRRRHPAIAAKLDQLRGQMEPGEWAGLMEKLPEAIAGQLDVTLDGYLSRYLPINNRS